MQAATRIKALANQLTTRTYATATTAAMTDPSNYKFNHTMLRVKDPKKSLAFYKHLGMSEVNKFEFPDNKFDLYFLAYDAPGAPSHGKHWTDREGIIELTHNYGTEDSDWKAHNGNKQPQGFGHVCVSVDNIQAACKRISDAGYTFQKKLEDGRMRHIAFALDPDDYWVEIIAQNPVDKTEGVTTTDTATYRMNHTMIRVKDKDKSIKFYEDVMGMNLKRTSENEAAKFNLYFLGYGSESGNKSANGVNPTAEKEGLLELTWNYGTEKEEGKVYHDGNAEPQGFGHICVSVDDLDAACKRMDDKGVEWKKRLTDGRMKNVAFVLDPDGYWIEVVQNESLKAAPGKY
ncbi:Lactoylglutathione lyase [Elasticomyces elasticus]|nr:Lactoylglutathione lyase [Elasticomyces elasticus]KAK4922794.1 Lactoylglutathione lyase [Elasticomyces elasticus]KAK5769373.1 Lactoylglutathione lyase [Elasticomyces elasticus]